jgi:hypothetical protein
MLFKTSPGGGGAGGGGGSCACAREVTKAITNANGKTSKYLIQAFCFGLLIVFIKFVLVNESWGIMSLTVKERYC